MVTPFPNGVSSWGVPVLPGIGPTFGDVYWLNSAGDQAGDGGGAGTKNQPFATLAGALAQMAADDALLVAPTHAEAISAEVLIDLDGVQIVGIGNGARRPTFTFDNTSGHIEIDPDGVRITNCRFIAAVSGISVCLDVDGDGCVIDHNYFSFSVANQDDLVTTVDNLGDSTLICDNWFDEDASAAAGAQCIRSVAGDRVRIERNVCVGNKTAGMIVGNSLPGDELMILDNNIFNAAAAPGIVVTGTSTGLMAYNRVGSSDTAAGDAISAGDMRCIENYSSNDDAESGILIPAATST